MVSGAACFPARLRTPQPPRISSAWCPAWLAWMILGLLLRLFMSGPMNLPADLVPCGVAGIARRISAGFLKAQSILASPSQILCGLHFGSRLLV